MLFYAASFARADYYYVQDLGTLGGNTSLANALNNLGQVVGLATTNNLGVAHAVLFSGTGSNNIDLDVLGGGAFIGEAKGINDSGQIVGEGTPAGGRIDAVLYKASGNVDLGDLCDTDTAGSAEAINNSGTVIGFADDCSFTAEPCRYSGTGSGNTALPGISGGVNGVAYGINASGQSVGYVTRSTDQAQHATFFSNSGGNTVDLGTLGGFTSHAYGINDAGQIVGDSFVTGNSAFHATLFSGTGTNNIDLGDLGGNNSHAYAINNFGEIVGNSYPTNGSVYHAFIYKNGVMTDINGLVLPGSGFSNIRLVDAGSRIPGRTINDSGQIAAVGEISGRTHAVLLTPVLRKVSAARSGNDITITFDAVAGKTYRLEWTATLTNPTWQSVPGIADFTAVSTGQGQFVQSNGASFGKEFYRVRLL